MKTYIAIWATGLGLVFVIVATFAPIFPDPKNGIYAYSDHINIWFAEKITPLTYNEWITISLDNLPIIYLVGVLLIFVLYFIGRNLFTQRPTSCLKSKFWSNQEGRELIRIDGIPRELVVSSQARNIAKLDLSLSNSLRYPQSTPIPILKTSRPILAGVVIVVLFFGSFIGWAALAPLSNTAISPGKVKVEVNRRTIQHLEGGIVSRILVKNGDKVRPGQVLIELDETKARLRLARLEGQLQAGARRLELLNVEIKTVNNLLKKGYANKPRLLALQRRAAELEGERGRLTAEIEDAKDILQRSKIESPIEGMIVGMKIHTLGGVIKSGDALMDVAPKGERLIVQAHVNPRDIDVVHQGMKASVFLTPYNRRSIQPIEGRVITVSADLITNEQNNKSFYLADVELLENPQKAIKGVVLYPGMPVEVMILTGERTVLSSLFLPILQGVNRTISEN